MLNVYPDPLRQLGVLKRWALLGSLAVGALYIPIYVLLLDVPLLHAALIVAVGLGVFVLALELAARWEYRMRRRYAYPNILGYQLAALRDFQAACRTSASMIGRWLGARAVVIAWLDDNGHDLAPVAAYGMPEGWTASAPKISISARTPKETVEQGMVAEKPSAAGDPWFGSTYPHTRVIYVPLISQDQPKGLLALAAEQRNGLVKDWRLLIALAMVMALALDNCRLYEIQRASAQRMQLLNRMKSDLLITVSHELRTPLTSIRTAAEMLLEEEERANPESPRIRLVRNIVKGAARLSALVSDLVDFSRDDDFAPRLELELVPVVDLIKGAVAVIQPLTEAKGQTLDLQLPNDPGTVLVDRHRLEQVLINLLSNANRYTPPGGRITIRAERRQGEVVISVTDSGPGIPEGERHLIFEPFYRTGRSGLGMGLAIAKSLVERHNGRIWVESDSNQGSTFFVALPRYQPADAHLPSRAHAPS